MAPRQRVGWGAAGVSTPSHSAWHPRVAPGALLDLCLLALGPFLWPHHTAPHLCSLQSTSVLCWRAVCSIITAPVDVFEDVCQHRAPLAIPRQFWLTPYKQGSIVYGPSKALKVAGIIEVHLQHGIWHAMFFHPSSAFCAVQCSETEDFICHYQFLIDSPMAFYLIINVEEPVQGIEQHFWSVALAQNVLIPQSVALHGGCLKAHDALRLMLPVLLCSEGECPTGNNQ